jgi:hypothetical protein
MDVDVWFINVITKRRKKHCNFSLKPDFVFQPDLTIKKARVHLAFF